MMHFSNYVNKALIRGFQMERLMYSNAAHQAPRRLRHHGCLGKAISRIGNGILAGGKRGISFARLYLIDTVEELDRLGAEIKAEIHMFQHVDDVANIFVGENMFDCAWAIHRYAIASIDRIPDFKLTIANKKSIVIPDNEPSRRVVKAIKRRMGVAMAAAPAGIDIGIDSCRSCSVAIECQSEIGESQLSCETSSAAGEAR